MAEVRVSGCCVERGKQLWVPVAVCAAQRAVLICRADTVCLGFSEALRVKSLWTIV